MGPFQFEAWHNPYVQSISSLMLAGPQAQAAAAQQAADAEARASIARGQAWAGALGNIGQTAMQLGQLPLQIHEQQQRDQLMGAQVAHLKAQTAEMNALATGREQTAQQQQAIDQIFKNAMMQDPQTGQWSFNADLAKELMVRGGQGHLYPQYAEHFDKMQKASDEHDKQKNKDIVDSLVGIGELGYAPAAATATLSFLNRKGYVTDDQTSQLLQAIKQDPSADNIKNLVTNIGAQIPGYAQALEASKTAESTRQKNAAEAAKNQAEAKKLTAEVGGTLPQTPAQIETARHNAAMEKEAAGRLAEEVRAHKATEAAANPLTALTGQSGTPQAAAPPRLTGDDFLKNLPESVATQVKALAEGRMPFPTGFALRSPYWQAMVQAVSQYDPSFDAVNYNARAKTRADFTSGKSAQSVNALNTVISHMDKLSDAAEALNNTNYPALNNVLNSLSKAVGKPEVTNFDTIRKAVADEVTRVWRQAGGSQKDIEQAQNNLNAANSPAQLRGAIAEYGELLGGKLKSLQDQYAQGMGTDAVSMIRPDSQATLNKIGARAAGPESKPQAKTRTVDQINQLATQYGLSYAEAKKRAEAAGYTIVVR